MPVVELAEEQAINLSSFTVVGTVDNGIVIHVAILAEDVVGVTLGNEVSVYQMGPPMSTIVPSSDSKNEDRPDMVDVSDLNSSPYNLARLDVAACLEKLSDGEKRKMRRWYRKISEFFPETTRPKLRIPRRGNEKEYAEGLKICRYIAHPPIKKDTDQKTGNLKAIRYSCSGFVMDCFESTNVVKKLLLSWEHPHFPKICEDKIWKIWGRLGLTLIPELKDALGLLGEGPWPIVMPGYIVNTFDRHADDIRNEPFVPTVHHITVK